MANEIRRWANWVGGLVEDNPLASGATTLTSAGLAALPAVTSADHYLIVFDPDGTTGAPFAKRATLHTAGATTATIEAAAVIGTARSIDRDTPWAHTVVADDLRVIRRATAYRSSNQTGIADITWTDVDVDVELFDDLSAFDLSTNTFTAPAAGRIRVEACIEATAASIQTAFLRINKNSGTIIAYAGGELTYATLVAHRLTLVTGWRTCASGDTFKLQVYIDGTGTGTVVGDANGVASVSYEFLAD